MKIVYIQTYPAYHDFGDSEQWLLLENRDKWMPGITKELGHEAELWCIGSKRKNADFTWKKSFTYPIKMFKPDSMSGKTKTHRSSQMVNYAKEQEIDLYVLKGMDGGAGTTLLKEVILPSKIPFAFVIGGKWYSPWADRAHAILYETEHQKELLKKKTWRFWEKTCNDEQLIHLPKSTDTTLFKPIENIEKKYDIISMGRLIPYYKNYDALTSLSGKLSIGFIGGGPELEHFRNRFPEIDWIGPVPNKEVPYYLNKAKLFFYTGLRDHFPRVIVESASCGVPVVAFSNIFKKDVIPDTVGFLVRKDSYIDEIITAIGDSSYINQLSKSCREHASVHWNEESSRSAIKSMLSKLDQ
jgi:glycosyltransferase involved in cell wall biosynthesis